MNIVICLAGLNTRFHNAGFDIPKYLLPFFNSVVITHILTELTENLKINKIVLVANNRDIYFKRQLIMATHDFCPEIIYTDDTIGQAETALKGIEHLIENGLGLEPVIIHNGDTIVSIDSNDLITGMIKNNSVCVHTFEGFSKAWSYVCLEHNSNKITSINEKQIVTGHASSGLYTFQSSQFYKDSYNDTIFTAKEFYISDVIANIIKSGYVCANFSTHNLPIILGTPIEYFKACSQTVLAE